MSDLAVVEYVGHGLAVGTPFTFTTTGNLPNYVLEDFIYYVISEGYTVDSFEFASTENGIPIRITTGTDTGVHSVNRVAIAPVVGLDWSDDGGHTWSNRYFRSIGALGEYTQETTWNRLGASRNKRGRIFRIVITEPVKVILIGAYAEIEALR